MAATEFTVTLSLSAGLGIALLAFILLCLGQGQRFSGGGLLAFMCFPGILFIALTVLTFSDDSGLYTRTRGTPHAAQVEQLTYLTGFLGRTNRVRVDTDKGVFVLGSDVRVPRTGAIYIVKRQRDWGHAERTFLCLDATQARCWAERESGE